MISDPLPNLPCAPPSPIFGGLLGPIGQFGQAPMLTCPLILDLDGDGLEVTKMGYGAGASQIHFDLDSDGFAERTAWVQQGTQDGFLAIDRNGNGKIDNESEMFCVTNTFANGFENLRSFDSNGDGFVTAADTQWNDLRVWIDANGDAVTDAGELKTLAALGITSINVNSTQGQFIR